MQRSLSNVSFRPGASMEIDIGIRGIRRRNGKEFA